MKLLANNPWIDPRVRQVTPARVQAYLTQNGWLERGPASNPLLLRYERAEEEEEEDAPTLFLPREVQEGAELQWLIEAIEDLARFENRWAVEVLADVLGVASPSSLRTTNGASPARDGTGATSELQ